MCGGDFNLRKSCSSLTATKAGWLREFVADMQKNKEESLIVLWRKKRGDNRKINYTYFKNCFVLK